MAGEGGIGAGGDGSSGAALATINGNTTITGNLNIGSNTEITGRLDIKSENFSIAGNDVWPGEWEVVVDGPWLKKSHKLTFTNGILTYAESPNLMNWGDFWKEADGSSSDSTKYAKKSELKSLETKITALEGKTHLTTSDVNTLIGKYLSDNDYVTRAYISKYGDVKPGGDPSHDHTFLLP